MKISYYTMCALATATLVAGCAKQQDGYAHFAENMDTSVAMSDNFYQYANGGWMNNNPIPEDKSRLGSFDILHENSRNQIREIVEEAAKNKGAMGTPSQKIGDLYALGMDTVARDEVGMKPILPLLQMVDEISDDASLAKTLAKLNINGVYPFFAFYISADPGNSTMNISGLSQTGLGLPDRDYYLLKSERNNKLMEGYIQMLTKTFELAELDNAEARANNVVTVETTIAEKMNSRVENRDAVARYNKTDYKGLLAMAPDFDWDSFFAEVGLQPDEINVNQVKYFASIGNIIKSFDKAVVKDYLKACIFDSYDSYLSSDFVNNSFDFFGKQLSGTPTITPLWKRMVGTVEGVMGEQLGQLYVEKYFPASAKERISKLIEQLRIAFAQRIDSLSWMGDDTKARAKEKLSAFTVKVGYPDKWKDYSELIIDPKKSFVENIIEANKWEYKKELAKYGKEVDRTEWHMTPQTVNAYYSPLSNEIVFPAGILQPPFFYAEGDDAVNYGGIGVVIGHEMTHGFDDQGCQYDKDGNLNNWWTEDDAKAFAALTTSLADHFETLTVVDTVKCNGRLTLGENIADNGGLNIAYQALRNAVGNNDPMVDGLTIDERFILGYAQIWACNCRNEYLYNQATTDPHSPTHLRVNGQMMLFDLFYKTFNIPEGSPMYKAPEERIVVW
ncbi:MAG: M13 family metallopeptidase [Bacteroidales bacterium]|nr:M13 family metallopeptidase [Bacteroidales bacterium]